MRIRFWPVHSPRRRPPVCRNRQASNGTPHHRVATNEFSLDNWSYQYDTQVFPHNRDNALSRCKIYIILVLLRYKNCVAPMDDDRWRDIGKTNVVHGRGAANVTLVCECGGGAALFAPPGTPPVGDGSFVLRCSAIHRFTRSQNTRHETTAATHKAPQDLRSGLRSAPGADFPGRVQTG